MNRPELYTKTVNVLIDAYEGGNLKHGRCYFCAVGNICAEASRKLGIYRSAWEAMFATDGHTGIQERGSSVHSKADVDRAKRLLFETGYTIEELARVEFAFETSLRNTPLNRHQKKEIDLLFENSNYLDDNDNRRYIYFTEVNEILGQYIGLQAVLSVLKDIHLADDVTNDITRLSNVAISKGVPVKDLVFSV